MNQQLKRTIQHQVLFLITGLISTLGTQWLHYEKAAEPSTLLTILCMYLGMVSVKIIPERSNFSRGRTTSALKSFNKKSFWLVAFFEVIGNIVLTIGMFYVGSGLYQVIYASVIVFNAIFATMFLRRSIDKLQWIAVCIIVVGLSLQALGGPPKETASSGKESNQE